MDAVLPGIPVPGRSALIVGATGWRTVKLKKNDEPLPAGVVTVTVRELRTALASTVTVIGRLVAVPPEPIVAVTPVPLNVTAVAPVRFDPAIVADIIVP